MERESERRLKDKYIYLIYSGRTQKQVMAARRAESRQTEFARCVHDVGETGPIRTSPLLCRSSSVRYSTRSWNADYLMDGGGDTSKSIDRFLPSVIYSIKGGTFL